MSAKKKIICTLVLIFSVGTVLSQQQAMYTHYMYNTLGVNPGYAGSREALTVTALNRSQWVSFPGAPRTQTLTIHGPAFKEKLGLGLSVINDALGPVHSTSLYGDVSYRLTLDKKSTLAIGLKGGLNYFRGDFAGILLEDETDNVFQVDEASKARANFGIGFYYHRERFYLGLSSPGLMENNFTSMTINGSDESFFDQSRHYYVIAGSVIDISRDLMIKPTSLLKLTPGAPMALDLTGTLIYRERFNIGMMYRTSNDVGLLLGMNLNEQLYVGYSYDWSFANKTMKYNGGSHELMMRYDFIFKQRKKIKSPRYF